MRDFHVRHFDIHRHHLKIHIQVQLSGIARIIYPRQWIAYFALMLSLDA